MNEIKRQQLIKQMQAEFLKIAQLLKKLDENLEKKGSKKRAAKAA